MLALFIYYFLPLHFPWWVQGDTHGKYLSFYPKQLVSKVGCTDRKWLTLSHSVSFMDKISFKKETSYLHGPSLTPKQVYYIGSGDLPLKVLIMLSEAYSDVQETDRNISGIHPRTKRFERVTWKAKQFESLKTEVSKLWLKPIWGCRKHT